MSLTIFGRSAIEERYSSYRSFQHLSPRQNSTKTMNLYFLIIRQIILNRINFLQHLKQLIDRCSLGKYERLLLRLTCDFLWSRLRDRFLPPQNISHSSTKIRRITETLTT